MVGESAEGSDWRNQGRVLTSGWKRRWNRVIFEWYNDVFFHLFSLEKGVLQFLSVLESGGSFSHLIFALHSGADAKLTET